MSEISVNSILDASGGATTTINGFTPTVSNMAGRNRIINGDMRISQRNAGAAVTPSVVAQYIVDRFVYVGTQTSKLTLQQVSDSPTGFNSSLRFSVAVAATPSASDQFRCNQPIEGFNIADFGWGTATAQAVTVSFRAKASVAGNYSVALWNAGNTRSYVTTVALTTAWATYSFTVVGDTSGTWAVENTTGIELIFDLGSGSNWVAPTTNVWQAGGYFRASGSVSFIGNASATLNVTGVQLEAGSVATPFEHRQYGQELALCQRYFQKSWPVETAVGTASSLGSHIHGGSNVAPTTGLISGGSVNLKANLRAAPSVVLYDTAGASGVVQRWQLGVNNVNGSNAVSDLVSSTAFLIYSGSGSSSTGIQAHYTASAEL